MDIRVLLLAISLSLPSSLLFGQSSVENKEDTSVPLSTPLQTAPSMRDWDTFVTLFKDVTDDETLPYDQDLMEDLFERYCQPLNLNQPDSAELSALPFLTSRQVSDICAFVRRNKPLHSTGALAGIESLDYGTRCLLQCFTYAGPLPTPQRNLSTLLHSANHELVLRTNIPLYTKAGYKHVSAETLKDNPNKAYVGSRTNYSAWYEATIGHAQTGLILEKDPGERHTDYWSAYYVINRWRCINQLVVGNYRASFGLGLVINTGSRYSKRMVLQTLGATDRGFRKHSSTAESGYLRGIGVSLRLSNTFSLSAYASTLPVDATLRNDSTGISTLKTDGLHRTPLEISKKGNTQKTDGGVSLQWHNSHFRLSATAAYTHFSLPLRPIYNTPSTLYRRYNARGQDFLNIGVTYAYTSQNLRFVGETASDRQGHSATLNMLQTDICGNHITLIQRYYPARYVSVNGRTFSENSSPQNENALYVGWKRPLSHNSTLSAYIDLVYSPWLKYRVSRSSFIVDGEIQYAYTSRHDRLLSVCYRIKSKQKDQTLPSRSTTYPGYYITHNLRSQYSSPLSPNLSFRGNASLLLLHTLVDGLKTGYAVGSTLRWHISSTPRSHRGPSVSWGITYFHTDDYSTRIYAYEPGLLYSFSMTGYQNHGIRSLVNVCWPLSRHLTLLGKAASTYYFDRKTIGTGLEEISRQHCEDLQFQLRIQL